MENPENGGGNIGKLGSYPIGSIYGIFAYRPSCFFIVHVGKYTILGSYGYDVSLFLRCFKVVPENLSVKIMVQGLRIHSIHTFD